MLALIVDPDAARLSRMTDIMRAAGYRPISVSCFEEARRCIEAGAINVLVVQERLGAYHGVHLLYLARRTNPHVTVVVVTREPDAFLERELTVMGGVRTLAIADLPTLVQTLADVALHSHGPPLTKPM
jgi:DNA-binding NtrC family response regulator